MKFSENIHYLDTCSMAERIAASLLYARAPKLPSSATSANA
jgi:hypothetical protein